MDTEEITNITEKAEEATGQINEKMCGAMIGSPFQQRPAITTEQKNTFITETKENRKALDVLLQVLKASDRTSPEKSTAIRKLQECIMWLGMDLKDLGTTNPYPNSYNPTNTVVDPTADGLKF